MTPGWISPRWVPTMLYGLVLAVGLYYSAAGLGGGGQGARTAGFAAVMAVLLVLEVAPRRPAAGQRRWPAAALLAARLALFVAAAALDPSGESRALFVLVPFAAYFAFGRAVALTLGGLCLALLIAGFTLRVPRWYGQAAYLSDVLMFGVGLVLAIAMAGIAVGEQAARARLEAALGDLAESNARLTAYAAQVADLSAEAERTRLARDIHDSLGHHLTAIAVQLEKAEAFRDRDPAEAGQAVAGARWSAREALREVRESVRALRAGEPRASLSDMLVGLVRQAGPDGLLVTLSVADDEGAISPAARMALYRAAQEALTNARRHSGARTVSVLVELSEDEARLVVTDNGRGFTPAAVLPAGAGAFRDPDGGVGLLGIRERAALAGGHAEVDSSPGAGTTVTVRIPRSDARPATGAVHQTTAGRAP